MPELPPDPRALINARIHHFKKESQKLNMEFLEAAAELERAKQAVQQSKSGRVTPPVPKVVSIGRIPSAGVPEQSALTTRPHVVVQPFAEGVGYSLATQGVDLWFDTEEHAITYSQDVFANCEIRVLNRDGTLKHHYGALSSGES